MKRYNRLSLGFLLVLILISVCLVNSVTGINENNNNVSSEKFPQYLFAQSNGLIAYWSFDEGDGNIAYDYSGNNYNGIIYGASWSTGQSSYALDFDGEDDYVSLDLYASDLGFNKTDDYKISAWIKSVSSETGIIFEISDESDFVPRAFLELNDDGTLEFKVQSTEHCDVELRTNNSYNNGLWHYIECIYHGDSSNPIIEVYVNNELVGSASDWLCPMSSHQFKKAKIGVRGYQDEKYFNGLIDEVKIYKKPDGNQPPDAPIISGPSSGTVGEEYIYSFVASDPEVEDIKFFIDWGDKTNTGWIGPFNSSEEVHISHTWYTNDTYDIRARVRDNFDVSNWSNYLIAMGNVAPYKPSLTGPLYCKKDTLYDFTFLSIDLNDHDLKYFIDWGDGETEWTDYYASGEEVTISHKWSTQGIKSVKVKAKDIYESESEISDPLWVKVTQKALLLGLISNINSEDQVTTFNARFVIYFSLSPINFQTLSSNEKITVLNDHNGVINDLLVLGNFYSLVQ